MFTKEEFARRLIDIRKKKKLMQKDAADLIGLSRQTLSNYESSKRTPKVEEIFMIAEAYSVSADYLIGLSDISSVVPDIQQAAKTTGLRASDIETLDHMDVLPRDCLSLLIQDYERKTASPMSSPLLDQLSYCLDLSEKNIKLIDLSSKNQKELFYLGLETESQGNEMLHVIDKTTLLNMMSQMVFEELKKQIEALSDEWLIMRGGYNGSCNDAKK